MRIRPENFRFFGRVERIPPGLNPQLQWSLLPCANTDCRRVDDAARKAPQTPLNLRALTPAPDRNPTWRYWSHSPSLSFARCDASPLFVGCSHRRNLIFNNTYHIASSGAPATGHNSQISSSSCKRGVASDDLSATSVWAM